MRRVQRKSKDRKKWLRGKQKNGIHFLQHQFNTQIDTAYESIVELDDHEGEQ